MDWRSPAVTLALLAVAAQSWATGPEIVDYSDPATLTSVARHDYGSQYQIIGQPAYSLRLVTRSPGAANPPRRHNANVFLMALDDGRIQHSPHVGGTGIQEIHAGDMFYFFDLNAVSPASTADQPMRFLELLAPPIDDDMVDEATAAQYLRANEKRHDAERRKETHAPFGPSNPGANVRGILQHLSLGRRTFVSVPLFPRKPGTNKVQPLLLIFTKPRSFTGSLKKELILIPVEGQASVEFQGSQAGTLRESANVLRLPIRDLSKITVTPQGGRFAAVAVLISD